MAETILFLAHTEADGTLSKATREALACAHALGGDLVLGMVGAKVAPAIDCHAVRYLAVCGEDFAAARYSTDAAAAEALYRAAGATVVVAAQTTRWARVLAGVAQRVGGRVDTHVTQLTQTSATRWLYRQRMEAVSSRPGHPWFVLVESGIAPAFTGSYTIDNIEQYSPGVSTRTVVTSRQAPKSEQQTIRPEAGLLFVAGAGWTKKQKDGRTHTDDAGRLILGFLEKSQASLGSSKSLVDLSGEGQAVLPFLSHMNQVGQTGSTPRHPKGLATCCHGEEPHVVGWRFIKERRAVNLDPNCGWARGKADVLYVADAFEVMERVNALLEERVPASVG
ncbi:MAG TPA: hypothetical protein VKU01_26410 [Bryobacteraceae bacterium]|nr:hypothetical protein [Bryobacteraceae bacterium]